MRNKMPKKKKSLLNLGMHKKGSISMWLKFEPRIGQKMSKNDIWTNLCVSCKQFSTVMQTRKIKKIKSNKQI